MKIETFFFNRDSQDMEIQKLRGLKLRELIQFTTASSHILPSIIPEDRRFFHWILLVIARL
jgi:hypothetical protein